MTDYFHLDAAPDHIRAISNLGLAHLGDAVFEVMVRSWLCLRGKATSKGLHRATVHFVAAPAQAAMAEKILPLLSEEEGDVFRRGRNASPMQMRPLFIQKPSAVSTRCGVMPSAAARSSAAYGRPLWRRSHSMTLS